MFHFIKLDENHLISDQLTRRDVVFYVPTLNKTYFFLPHFEYIIHVAFIYIRRITHPILCKSCNHL